MRKSLLIDAKIMLRVSSLYERFQDISKPEIPVMGFKRLWFELSIQRLSRGFVPESLKRISKCYLFGFLFFW